MPLKLSKNTIKLLKNFINTNTDDVLFNIKNNLEVTENVFKKSKGNLDFCYYKIVYEDNKYVLYMLVSHIDYLIKFSSYIEFRLAESFLESNLYNIPRIDFNLDYYIE